MEVLSQAFNGWKEWLRRWATALVVFSTVSLTAAADREVQVKGALLSKLASFVEWPSDSFTSTNSPLVLGILGQDPFGREFDKALAAVTIQNRRFEVRRFNTAERARDCHILFISRSESNRVQTLLTTLRSAPVLTVADFNGFAAEGGMLNFIKVNGRLRFEANPDAATQAGLKISSRLLQVSDVVRSRGGKE
jgi:hypothetical protein